MLKTCTCMKTYSFLIGFACLLITLGGCRSNPIVARATGFAYEIVVTMSQADWDGIAGEAIKEELRSNIPGLPQPEPAFKITYVPPKHFNGMLTYVRNILIVNIDPAMYTKVTLKYENDTWAQGQMVMTMNAPDAASVAEYMETNQRRIVDFFTKIEMNRAATSFAKTYSADVLNDVQNRFGIKLNVPSDITYIRNGKDFFWASNNANAGRTDVVVYTFPYRDENTFTREYLIQKRDSVLKLNLPGSYPDSYMATETRFGPTYTPLTIRGKYCGELRGLWKMENDMMGGPFVSHARLDEKNHRVVVVEGFVFAPESDKRNYIRRIEAALYTLRLPDELDQPVAETLKELGGN